MSGLFRVSVLGIRGVRFVEGFSLQVLKTIKVASDEMLPRFGATGQESPVSGSWFPYRCSHILACFCWERGFGMVGPDDVLGVHFGSMLLESLQEEAKVSVQRRSFVARQAGA